MNSFVRILQGNLDSFYVGIIFGMIQESLERYFQKICQGFLRIVPEFFTELLTYADYSKGFKDRCFQRPFRILCFERSFRIHKVFFISQTHWVIVWHFKNPAVRNTARIIEPTSYREKYAVFFFLFVSQPFQKIFLRRRRSVAMALNFEVF